MNVAIVQVHVPHYRLPFYERLVACSKHRYTLIHGLAPQHEYSGVAVSHVPCGLPIRNYALTVAGRTLVLQPAALAAILRRRYDLTIITSFLALPMNLAILAHNRLAGRPTLLWTNLWHRNPKGWVRPLLSAERRLYQCPDGLLAYSPRVREQLLALGVADCKIRVVPNAVAAPDDDDSTPRPQDRNQIRAALGLGDHRILLVLGKLSPEKRPFDAVAAFRRLVALHPDLLLVFVGSGPLQSELMEQTKDLADRCRILGKVAAGAEWDWLSVAEIVLFAGHIGLAANQAMAAGCAIVASDVLSAESFWLQDGHNCAMFKAGQVATGAERISLLLSQPAVADRLGQQARHDIAQSATLAGMVTSFETAVDELTAQYAAQRMAAGHRKR